IIFLREPETMFVNSKEKDEYPYEPNQPKTTSNYSLSIGVPDSQMPESYTYVNLINVILLAFKDFGKRVEIRFTDPFRQTSMKKMPGNWEPPELGPGCPQVLKCYNIDKESLLNLLTYLKNRILLQPVIEKQFDEFEDLKNKKDYN
ncbi:hypothetical protein HDV02_003280, partial [Globomyces sp. JEL0801]